AQWRARELGRFIDRLIIPQETKIEGAGHGIDDVSRIEAVIDLKIPSFRLLERRVKSLVDQQGRKVRGRGIRIGERPDIERTQGRCATTGCTAFARSYWTRRSCRSRWSC